MAAPRPEEMKEWASSAEAKHFKKLLQEQLDDAKAGFVAGDYDRPTLEETAIVLMRLQERMRAIERTISTLEDMAAWEPEGKTEGESNVY